MNRYLFLFLIFIMLSNVFAQKKGSQEVGGGLSFWTASVEDSTESNFDVNLSWGLYLTRDFLFEVEPKLVLHFNEEKTDISAFFLFGLSKRLIDMTSYDRYRRHWDRKSANTTAGIYGSIDAGLWLDNDQKVQDGKVFMGPAFSLGLGTRSLMGSFSMLRTRFQYIYSLPALPLHENGWSMFTVNIGLSIITKL